MQQQPIQQQQNAPAPSPFDQLYSTNDPLLIGNSFLTKEHPSEKIIKEIEDFQKNLEKQHGKRDKIYNTESIYSYENALDQYSNSPSLIFDEPQFNRVSSSMVFEEEYERQRAKDQRKLDKILERSAKAQLDRLKASSTKSSIIRRESSLYLSNSLSFTTNEPKLDLSKRKSSIMSSL